MRQWPVRSRSRNSGSGSVRGDEEGFDISIGRDECLSHVLWIGGPAGAGKTTVTRLLARRHGLRWYNCDAQTWQHLDRAVATGIRNAQRFAALTPAQRQLARSEDIEYDRGPLIVEDLRALPGSPVVVVDGAPPDAVSPGLEGAPSAVPGQAPSAVPGQAASVGPGQAASACPGQVVWLLTSHAVQRARLEQRHPDGVPTRYLQEWERIAGYAATSGAPVVTVDALSVEQTVAEVERVFARRLAEGPVATTVAGRRELLRYSNRTIVAQCRGWLAHQPNRDLRPAAQMFECECARPTCTALVELPVETAEAVMAAGRTAITAAGH